jgi:membrane protease YdiL (CAAX protease family)
MPIPIHIPDDPNAAYLTALLVLGSVAPLVVATRIVAIARITSNRVTVPLYVGFLAAIAITTMALDPAAFVGAWSAHPATSLALGIGGIPVAWMLDRAIVDWIRRNTWHPRRPARLRSGAPLAPVLASGSAIAVIGGWLEEIVYRFVLLGLLTATSGGVVAVFVTTVAYALIHSGFGWSQVVAKLVLGSFFLLLLAVSGGLLAPCVAHAGFNALAMRALSRQIERVAPLPARHLVS